MCVASRRASNSAAVSSYGHFWFPLAPLPLPPPTPPPRVWCVCGVWCVRCVCGVWVGCGHGGNAIWNLQWGRGGTERIRVIACRMAVGVGVGGGGVSGRGGDGIALMFAASATKQKGASTAARRPYLLAYLSVPMSPTPTAPITVPIRTYFGPR